MKQHINILREFSVPLICGVVLAIVWANIDPTGYLRFISTPLVGTLSLHFISNDIFMVLFFGIAAVEITQSCLPGGELNPLSRAINPILGTLGGVLGPVLLYLGLNAVSGVPQLNNGLGDSDLQRISRWPGWRHAWCSVLLTAGRILSALIGGGRRCHRLGRLLRCFILIRSTRLHPYWLLLTGLGMAVAYALRRLRVYNYWPYVIVGGGPELGRSAPGSSASGLGAGLHHSLSAAPPP